MALIYLCHHRVGFYYKALHYSVRQSRRIVTDVSLCSPAAEDAPSSGHTLTAGARRSKAGNRCRDLAPDLGCVWSGTWLHRGLLNATLQTDRNRIKLCGLMSDVSNCRFWWISLCDCITFFWSFKCHLHHQISGTLHSLTYSEDHCNHDNLSLSLCADQQALIILTLTSGPDRRPVGGG